MFMLGLANDLKARTKEQEEIIFMGSLSNLSMCERKHIGIHLKRFKRVLEDSITELNMK